MGTVELLAPAGNPEALAAALGEGADAVYLGLKTFNARMRSSNFAFNQFEATVEAAHKLSRKVYVTVNTVFVEREADRLYQLLQYLERVGPDGVIVQDLGTVRMARDHFPALKLHASTQMNVGSARGANVLSRHGFKRVVLSRELSLDEIRKVHEGTNLELEVFVHGALCVSASGLCLFSSYLGGKSANRGLCTQACRRLYSADDESGYYFSPDDLELVSRVPELVEAGVSSFKIEGRLKSQEYVGAVVAAYRYMLDNWKIDRERALAKAQAFLQADFARSKTLFNIEGTFPADFIKPEQSGGTGIKLGRVKEIRAFEDAEGEGRGQWALVTPKDAEDGRPAGIGAAGIGEGDSVRVHRADDSGRLTLKVKGTKEGPKGIYLQLEGDYRVGDEVYLVQTKSMGKRWKPLLPKDLGRYHKFPSRDLAPRPRLAKPSKVALGALPEGIYALVGRVGDLHVLLAQRPEKAMILFDRKNADLMRRHEKELPFKRDSLVLWLDPYFPEGDAAWLEGELDYWIGRGQTLFVANNVAHLGMLRGRKGPRGEELLVVAGPWLYAFNPWAAAFVAGEGASFVVPPYEIGKQDFQQVAESLPAQSFMPIVFSWPTLFRIRADLAGRYDFRQFADREGGNYELHSGGDYSTVTPETAFSLVDRVPFLRKEGVGRFIVDFSGVELQKPIYKQVMKALDEGRVLDGTSRFNWKDGFWRPPEEGAGAGGGDGAAPRRAEGPAGAARGPGAFRGARTGGDEGPRSARGGTGQGRGAYSARGGAGGSRGSDEGDSRAPRGTGASRGARASGGRRGAAPNAPTGSGSGRRDAGDETRGRGGHGADSRGPDGRGAARPPRAGGAPAARGGAPKDDRAAGTGSKSWGTRPQGGDDRDGSLRGAPGRGAGGRPRSGDSAGDRSTSSDRAAPRGRAAPRNGAPRDGAPRGPAKPRNGSKPGRRANYGGGIEMD